MEQAPAKAKSRSRPVSIARCTTPMSPRPSSDLISKPGMRKSFRAREDDGGIAALMGEPLQVRLTFRAALDMLFDRGVRPITERVGAE